MPPRSEPLQRGEVVRVRSERWRVTHVVSYEGCAVVALTGAEASNAGATSRFILPFEPLDRLGARCERPRVVGRAMWRRISAAALAEAVPGWRSLRAAARADIVLFPYQLEPALAMVSGRACRLLLADEVGLGKTVQAGLLVAELLAREPDASVLIVTPAGLRDQWRSEMRERFAIDAATIDASTLARAAVDLPPDVNPWSIPRVAITSIDFVKRPDVIRALEPLTWDLVAFDEAHALSGRSDRSAAAALIAARARRVVIITATPHSGDPTAFDRLRALGRLGDEDTMLTFRRSRADAGIRGARVTRRLRIRPTPAEARMHSALRTYTARVSREAPADTAPAARLAMIVLARRAASSAASLARSIERRMTLLDEPSALAATQLALPLDDGCSVEDEEPLAELGAPGLCDPLAERRSLERILTLALAVGRESKVAALQRILSRTSERALVFTEYRDTLGHLAAVLQRDAAVLHGGLSAPERAIQARRFTHGDASLLLATDAASEGLNLHRQCRLVINMDVPWTPLRLEQRVGRVDRLGQRRRVHATMFVGRGTEDERVALALDARALRADREAPFGRSDDGDRSRRSEAADESTRLERVRRLTCARLPAPAAGAPVVTAAVRNRAGGLVLAIRLLFVDAAGAIVWDTIKGLMVPGAGCSEPRHEEMRAWFHASTLAAAVPLAAAAAAVHDRELASLTGDVRAALHPLILRERALLERVAGSTARLAAPLLQPGLFDRRNVREFDAQRRVMEQAVARSEGYIRSLERQVDVVKGERTLVFALAPLR